MPGISLKHCKTRLFVLFLQNEGEDFSYVIAFFLGTAACLYQVCFSVCIVH